MSEPRILFYDIETAGVNALKADLGFVICFGYKWLGEKKAHCLTISEEDLRAFDDRALLMQASKLMEKADLVVGHYASVFDRRFIQGRLLIHNLPPIPPTKMRDTCMIARSVGNYSSNRLKYLAKILKLGSQKLENDWPRAWFRVMQGDMEALKGLAHYCKGDVLALEDLYLRLRPFDNPHPRVRKDREGCRVCGAWVQYRGVAVVGEHHYRRLQCTKCGKWDRERKALR